MQRVLIGLGIVLVVGVALLTGLTSFGVDVFGYGVVWNAEKARVTRLARSFLEDLQYKDFEEAASYHTHADQKKVDIADLIEDMFKVEPEQLNIRDFQIEQSDLDEAGDRARTHFTADLELLNTSRKKNGKETRNKEREVEGILYWHKRPATEAIPPEKRDLAGDDVPDEWFMKLESSLHDD